MHLGDVTCVLGRQRLKGHVDWRQRDCICELAIEGQRAQLQVEASEGMSIGDDDGCEVGQRRVWGQCLEQTTSSTAALADELGGCLALTQYPSDVVWVI